MRDSNSLRGEWRLCKVVQVYPDVKNIVRNVDVLVAAKVDGSTRYKFQLSTVLPRHVSNLVVILPVEHQNGAEVVPDKQT